MHSPRLRTGSYTPLFGGREAHQLFEVIRHSRFVCSLPFLHSCYQCGTSSRSYISAWNHTVFSHLYYSSSNPTLSYCSNYLSLAIESSFKGPPCSFGTPLSCALLDFLSTCLLSGAVRCSGITSATPRACQQQPLL